MNLTREACGDFPALAEAPSTDDLRLLIPLAVSLTEPEWFGVRGPDLAPAIAKSRTVRRELVEAMVKSPDTASQTVPWYLARVLQIEDVDWLTELAVTRGTHHPWLWDLLLNLVSRDGVPSAQRVAARAKIEEACPGEIARHEEMLAAARRANEKYEMEVKRHQEEALANTFKLEQLIDDTLSSQNAFAQAEGHPPLMVLSRRQGPPSN